MTKPLMPFFGAEDQRGINSSGDVVTQTVDGRDLNEMWAEFQAVMALYNAGRQRLVDLLTFPVSNVIEDVAQVGATEFEEASEFGLPKGAVTELTYFSMAYDFKWYDLAKRFTWQFLAEASAAQVESIHQAALEADNRLIFKKVMNTIFRNTTRQATIRGNNYNVYPLYNGDGTVPPSYKDREFTGTESHYMVSGSATLDSKDIEDLYDKLRFKGFSVANGTVVFAMVNSAQAGAVRSWRAGQANANGAVATYDFVPAVGQPGLIVPNQDGLLGSQPASSYAGLPVIGSYGNILIIEEDYIPAGYVLMIGSGGEGNLNNPVGYREHANTGLRGLRLIEGGSTHPIVNSVYQRGFGTGIRQRGGAAVLQVKATGAYEIPAKYAL